MKSSKIKKSGLDNSLYIVATPIGNLGDISKRATKVLQETDFIICENPQHSLKLLNNQGIKKKLVSLHDYNEKKIINKIANLKHSSKIGLMSDAGSPLISDPGYKLVKYFIDNNLYVTTIPGASSIVSALQLSGLPMHNFAFYGFVPKQGSKIKKFFTKMKDNDLTGVLFVSAKNLNKTIHNIIDFMGEREMAVCKEITKLNEYIYRDKASKILKLLSNKNILLKGEFTLVVSGRINKNAKKITDDTIRELNKLLKKYNLTEAVKIVHSLTGISRKEIYQIAIKLRDG